MRPPAVVRRTFQPFNLEFAARVLLHRAHVGEQINGGAVQYRLKVMRARRKRDPAESEIYIDRQNNDDPCEKYPRDERAHQKHDDEAPDGVYSELEEFPQKDVHDLAHASRRVPYLVHEGARETVGKIGAAVERHVRGERVARGRGGPRRPPRARESRDAPEELGAGEDKNGRAGRPEKCVVGAARGERCRRIAYQLEYVGNTGGKCVARRGKEYRGYGGAPMGVCREEEET